MLADTDDQCAVCCCSTLWGATVHDLELQSIHQAWQVVGRADAWVHRAHRRWSGTRVECGMSCCMADHLHRVSLMPADASMAGNRQTNHKTIHTCTIPDGVPKSQTLGCLKNIDWYVTVQKVKHLAAGQFRWFPEPAQAISVVLSQESWVELKQNLQDM